MHFHFDNGFPLICVYFSVSRQCFCFLSISFFFFLLLLSLFANNFTFFLYTSVILISPPKIHFLIMFFTVFFFLPATLTFLFVCFSLSLSYCVLHSFLFLPATFTFSFLCFSLLLFLPITFIFFLCSSQFLPADQVATILDQHWKTFITK